MVGTIHLGALSDGQVSVDFQLNSYQLWNSHLDTLQMPAFCSLPLSPPSPPPAPFPPQKPSPPPPPDYCRRFFRNHHHNNIIIFFRQVSFCASFLPLCSQAWPTRFAGGFPNVINACLDLQGIQMLQTRAQNILISQLVDAPPAFDIRVFSVWSTNTGPT